MKKTTKIEWLVIILILSVAVALVLSHGPIPS